MFRAPLAVRLACLRLDDLDDRLAVHTNGGQIAYRMGDLVETVGAFHRQHDVAAGEQSSESLDVVSALA